MSQSITVGSLTPDAIDSPARPLGGRLTFAWRTKVVLTVALFIYFCAFYFLLQRLALFEVRSFELGKIDQAVPFRPTWVWVYQSIYLFMPIAPWLAVTTRDLKRYTLGFLMLSLVGFGFFTFYPVEGPRPITAVTSSQMYQLLVSYDGARNAFPSLHCGLTLYHLMFARRVLLSTLGRPARIVWTVLGTLWALAIFYSTLATKQHYFVDIPAGLALAALAHGLIWRLTWPQEALAVTTKTSFSKGIGS